MAKFRPITSEVKAVLDRSVVGPTSLKLPPERLDPKLYKAVNTTLEDLGGKWNKSAQAHLFDSDPRERIESACASGRTTIAENPQKALQEFYTPAALAAHLVALASVCGKRTLEPSCGVGAIARECVVAGASSLTLVDVNAVSVDKAAAVCANSGRPMLTFVGDFLKTSLEGQSPFDRIVMNPPFSNGQDFSHVRQALGLLLPFSGVLVSVIQGNSNLHALQRRVLAELKESDLSLDFEMGRLPPESFKESGTCTHTAVLRVTNVRRAKQQSINATWALPQLNGVSWASVLA